MNNKAFLHIADMHLSQPNLFEKVSRFQENSLFLDKLIDKIEKECSKNSASLEGILLCGDVANCSSKEEYRLALEILKEISEKFQLKKECILVVPGNHDISWDDLKMKVRDDPNIKKQDICKLKEKYKEFNNFYNELYENECFDNEKAVINLVKNEQLKIAFLAINTQFQESYQSIDHKGVIDIEQLKSDLKNIESEINGYFKIALFHHNPVQVSDIAAGVQCWNDIKYVFNHAGIYTFISGHVHTNTAGTDTKSESDNYLSGGSIGLIEEGVSNSFNLLISENSKKIKILNYKYEPNDPTSYWQKHDNPNMIKEIIIDKDQSIEKKIDQAVKKVTVESTGLPFSDGDWEKTNNSLIESIPNNDVEENIQNEIMQFIKRRHLLQTGHFHLSPKVRTHMLIDCNAILGDIECMDLIKNYFFQQIRSSKIPDLVIGYSMPGNVLGSILALGLNKEYTYIPYLYRDYCLYEEELPMKEDVKNILIVLDCIYSKETVKNIVDKLNHKYNNIEHIIVLSIFNFLSMDKCQEQFSDKVNYESNYISDNITLYSICNNKLEKCPYEQEKDCFICEHDLAKINKYY